MIRCPICNSLKTEDEPCPGCLVKYGLEMPDGDAFSARGSSFRARLSALWTPAVLFAPVTVGLCVCTFVVGLAVSQSLADDSGSGAPAPVTSAAPVPPQVRPVPPMVPPAVPVPPAPPVTPMLAEAELEEAARWEAEDAARRAAEEAARARHEADRAREEAMRSREAALRGQEEALRHRENAQKQAEGARQQAEHAARQAAEAAHRAEHAEVAYHQLLEAQEAGHHDQVLARSEEVLTLRSVWSGRQYTDRVSRAYALRAQAANALWQAGGSAERAQQTAVDWAEYARAAGRSAADAIRLCQDAGGAERCSP